MKTYLITGCAGFIGSNFVHYMLKKYPEILLVNLDKLTYAGNLENLKDVEGDPRHVFVQGDICDKELVESLFAKYDFDYVINFAAESHVDRSIKNPEIFVQSNVMGTVNLLQRAKEAWYDADAKTWKEGKKYLQVSTDEVYGALGADGFFMETTPRRGAVLCAGYVRHQAAVLLPLRRRHAAFRQRDQGVFRPPVVCQAAQHRAAAALPVLPVFPGAGYVFCRRAEAAARAFSRVLRRHRPHDALGAACLPARRRAGLPC